MVKFSDSITRMREASDVVRNLFGNMSNPEIISFSGGAPAVEGLPMDEVREIVNDVISLDKRGSDALQYSKIMGLQDLREQIVDIFLTPKGIGASADDVMVVGGGLEGVYLLAQAVLNPGDVILVEDVTFVHAVATFQMAGATCIPCPTDDEGYIMDELEARIQAYHPKIVYAIPTFQNPTGKTLPENRRRRMAQLGSKYNVLILEDDPYGEIRYSGQPLKPIKSYDRTGHTVYANSFSKIFSPGIRLGYIVAEPALMSCLQDIKCATNSHTSALTQVIIAEFLKRGLYPDHLKRICEIHRERRDVMLQCIKEYFPENVRYTKPDGGLFIWLELPESLNATAMLQEAEETYKVAYVAGEGFYIEPGVGKNCMRISYGKTAPETIRVGMKRLGDLIASKI